MAPARAAAPLLREDTQPGRVGEPDTRPGDWPRAMWRRIRARGDFATRANRRRHSTDPAGHPVRVRARNRLTPGGMLRSSHRALTPARWACPARPPDGAVPPMPREPLPRLPPLGVRAGDRSPRHVA